MSFWRKIIQYIDRNPHRTLFFMMAAFVIVFAGFCWWKFATFQYNALDLAIYAQVFFNSSIGNWFHMTIFPNNYLGDHVELLIVPLVPLYAVFKHPFTLVFFQILWMASAAVPLYFIGKRLLSQKAGLVLAAIYLSHALVHNIAVFEFHMLSLAIPLTLWMFWFYLQEQFGRYFMFLILLIFVREDVALMVAAFSLIPYLEKRASHWWMTPLVLGGLWFPLAISIAQRFSGTYKYAQYYAWLGDSLPEIADTIVHQPVYLFSQLFSLDTLLFLLGILLCFGLLPLFKPKYLLPLLPILAQFLLSSASSGEVALKTHYTALFIPWCFIAAVYFWQQNKNRITKFVEAPWIPYAAIAVMGIFLFCTLSPLTQTAYAWASGSFQDRDHNAILKTMIEKIDANDGVAATENVLPHLAEREAVYAFSHIFQDTWKFSDTAFLAEEPVDWLLLDTRVIPALDLTYRINGRDSSIFYHGSDAVNRFLNQYQLSPVVIQDDIILFGKTNRQRVPSKDMNQLPASAIQLERPMTDQIDMIGYEWLEPDIINPDLVGISLYFKTTRRPQTPSYLRVHNKSAEKDVTVPLGYGLMPTNRWIPYKVYQMNLWFEDTKSLDIQFQDLVQGHYRIDFSRGISVSDDRWDPIGPTIKFKK